MVEYPSVFIRGVSDKNSYMEELNEVSRNIFKSGFKNCNESDKENNFVKFCKLEDCNHTRNGSEEVSITW